MYEYYEDEDFNNQFDAKMKAGDYLSNFTVWFELKNHKLRPIKKENLEKVKSMNLPTENKSIDSMFVSPEMTISYAHDLQERKKYLKESPDLTLVLVNFQRRPLSCMKLYKINNGKKNLLSEVNKYNFIKKMKDTNPDSAILKDIYDLSNSKRSVFFTMQDNASMHLIPTSDKEEYAKYLAESEYVVDLIPCTRKSFLNGPLRFLKKKNKKRNKKNKKTNNNNNIQPKVVEANIDASMTLIKSLGEIISGDKNNKMKSAENTLINQLKASLQKIKSEMHITKPKQNHGNHRNNAGKPNNGQPKHHKEETPNHVAPAASRFETVPLRTNSLFMRSYYDSY